MNIKAHLMLGGLFLLLSSCGHHNSKTEQTILDYKQQEARNYDVPLLIDFKTQSYNSSDQRTLIDGTSMLSIDDIVQFYTIEMERLGWSKVDIFDQGGNKKMVFEKPSKICLATIVKRSIMFNASQQHISISVSEKKACSDGPARSYHFIN